eukprot:CAMPEP_0206414564 /NCGR_PEP_ID=MMETSP0294-20121207/35468_1 /ASSEMBLY_ACC=CAM_ASM_000327 /TAXON_ID=39354 /ORGANISM="Heterosigma akashiwo, Strain CCMP2393" /LENGTH=73 /DNA_ID=CAMNT_0053876535 /DNA_START=15 /DNA_END=233 /DNA_ORIENTATION=-
MTWAAAAVTRAAPAASRPWTVPSTSKGPAMLLVSGMETSAGWSGRIIWPGEVAGAGALADFAGVSLDDLLGFL